MRLHWRDLGSPRADRADGKSVELAGFQLTARPPSTADYFLLMAEPGCCQGCVPANRLAVVEVFADQPLKLGTGQLRLTGTWRIVSDPEGWRYQLHGAEAKRGVTRRALMAASPLFCLPVVPAMADVAHGTYELVKKAPSVTTEPLVLSHTSLTDRPAAWTRRVLSDHARTIAATGGVIGIWPVRAYFPNVVAYADGIGRMVDVAGVNHVGLGTDQLGLPGGSAMPSYADLPQLSAAHPKKRQSCWAATTGACLPQA